MDQLNEMPAHLDRQKTPKLIGPDHPLRKDQVVAENDGFRIVIKGIRDRVRQGV